MFNYKTWSVGAKYFNGSTDFIEYSNDMDDIYKNIEITGQIRNLKY